MNLGVRINLINYKSSFSIRLLESMVSISGENLLLGAMSHFLSG